MSTARESARDSAHGYGPLSARNRDLARAQRRTHIRLRLRALDEAYAKASPLTKNLRQFVLVATYCLTWGDIWVSLSIVVSALMQLDWLELQVCLCSYRCGGEWHTQYTKTPNWNLTFVPDACPNEVWSCQVQQEWDECVCNQHGTAAAGGDLLLNVGGCDFYALTHAYLPLDAAVVALGLVMTTAMFKLAQFAPSADPVNLARLVFWWLPGPLQVACHAQPYESKALFLLSYAVFFGAWLASALLFAWAQVSDHMPSSDRSLELNPHAYAMPDQFRKVQEFANGLHALTLAAQTLGLYGWRLGVETQFRVTPRLKELKLKQPGEPGKPRVLFSVDRGGVGGRGSSAAGGGRAAGGGAGRSGSKSAARARARRERARQKFGTGQLGLAALGSGLGGLQAFSSGVLGGIGDGFRQGAGGFRRFGGDDDGEDEDGGDGDGVGDGNLVAGSRRALGAGAGLVGGVVGGVVGGLGSLATGVVGGGLNAVFGKSFGGGESDEDEVEVVDGEPLFLNVVTNIAPSSTDDGADSTDPDFILYFKVDFVDATGRQVAPAPGLPPPLLTLSVLPGEPDHTLELECVATQHKAGGAHSWVKRNCLGGVGGRSVHKYAVQLPASHFLGRHRLELRQPLASRADVAAAERRASSVAARGSGVGQPPSWALVGSNLRSSALEVGSDRFPSDDAQQQQQQQQQVDVEAAAAAVFRGGAHPTAVGSEAHDALLAACSYHEATDVTFVDPEVDKRKLLALEERLDAVDAAVAALRPAVAAIFARHAAATQAEGAVAAIHAAPPLHDYYVLLQMRTVGVAVSCAAIASGMVEDQSGPGGRAASLLKGAAALSFLGDHCGLPFAGLATALIGGAALAYAEHEKKVRVKRVTELWPTPAQADKVAEAVARAVCLNPRFAKQLLALDAADERDAAQKALPGQPGLVRRLGSVLKQCTDMATMADLSYADTSVKQRAEADAQLLVECVMSGRFQAALAARANARAAAAQEPRAKGGGWNSDGEVVEVLASLLAPPQLPGGLGGDGDDQTDGEESNRAGATPCASAGAAGAAAGAAAAAAASVLPPATSFKNLAEYQAAVEAAAGHNRARTASELLPPPAGATPAWARQATRASFSSSASSGSGVTGLRRPGSEGRGSEGRGGNSTIESYKAAARYLREGLEFTKATLVATYRYKLVLTDGDSAASARGPRLQWCRLDKAGLKGAKVHALPLDASLTVTAKAERTVVVTGAGGSGTFAFAHASQAQQFRACVGLVVAAVYGGSGGGSREAMTWEKSPLVATETDV